MNKSLSKSGIVTLCSLSIILATGLSPYSAIGQNNLTVPPNQTDTSPDGQPASPTTVTRPALSAIDPIILQEPAATGQLMNIEPITPTIDPNSPSILDGLPPLQVFTPPSTTPIDNPPRTNIPPLITPPITSIPTSPGPEACPAVQTPLATTPECPIVTSIPIIPQLPYPLIATPLLAVFVFWFVLNLVNRSQLKSESKISRLHLKNAHQQTVSIQRDKSYRQLLDFLTLELSSSKPFNQDSHQHLSSQIELLGSTEMRNLNQKITTAFQQQDRPEIKKLAKDLAAQIKKEF